MIVLYYLARKYLKCPPSRSLKALLYAFIMLIIFIYSVCINVLETHDTSNSSIPQIKPLDQRARLSMGKNDGPDLKGWALTFHDEFNDTKLNTSVWNVEDYGLYHYQNCCLYFGSQYFTSRALSLEKDGLHMISNKTPSKNVYTSGAITTENKFSFLYGRVDIRARFPRGQGMWPGLWMLSANADHEVDIMEMVNNPTIVYQTYHLNIPLYNLAAPQCMVTQPDLSRAFHVFSLIWNTSSLTWYIDGRQTCRVVNIIPETPMYLLLDAAVGGDWPGSPDLSTVFPQSTVIDYVRVYQASLRAPCSGLQVTSPLQLAGTTIAFGASISGIVTYTNRCTLPFVFRTLLISVRTIDGRSADFGNKDPMTLRPGQSVTINASCVIKSRDLIGVGYAFSTFETPDGKWHSDGTNVVKFTVTN